MNDNRENIRRSRRSFLRGGGAFIAGGIAGGVAASLPAASEPAQSERAELPWPWVKIDPMEAGSRAFHIYHDVGG